ncbi:Chaperone protein TorD [Pseudovibrio sp. Ad5]|uniref:molecular chaperone TorD n=1 Tax=Pseudovibrio sp. Ad5 TaxID=989436 RepID=UPI0007AED152|nr:molecular chaperone TorD [Pseudovibrio sp. Ad5]KZK93378.1 Chaperone protein TorD [Pseudovibrio sp. Ad5]
MGKHETITLSNSDRSLVYRWLASFFTSEAKIETLESYSSPEGRALLDVFSQAPALTSFTGELAKLTELSVESYQSKVLDLATAYSRLFLGVGGQHSAPPYESAYYNEKGTLFQKPTADMNKILQDLGISIENSMKEPADHLGVQLNVLAEYIDREALAEANGDHETVYTSHQNQIRFLSNHLLNWVPSFCESCKRFDKSDFYKELANALSAWLAMDLARLNEAKTIT